VTELESEEAVEERSGAVRAHYLPVCMGITEASWERQEASQEGWRDYHGSSVNYRNGGLVPWW